MKHLFILIIYCTGAAFFGNAQSYDTVYYTANWTVSEKPFAHYYRLAHLQADSFLYFKGMVKDYYASGQLQMQGQYSDSGTKEGLFTFYYPNGKVAAQGKYHNNAMYGNWLYRYPSGKEKATIYIAASNFIFLKYIDSTGSTTLMEGTGHFVWPFNEVRQEQYALYVKGTFMDGKRDNNWKFYSAPVFSDQNLQLIEQYKNGAFKNGTWWSGRYFRQNIKKETALSLEPFKFRNADRFLPDHYFGTFEDKNAFLHFITKKEEPLFIRSRTATASPVDFVINHLQAVRPLFLQKGGTYSAEIDFDTDRAGIPQNIQFSGNFSTAEKQTIEFLLKKFRGLQHGLNSETSTHYKLYVFPLAAKEIMPGTLYQWHDTFISNVPKAAFVKAAKEKIKEEKRNQNF